jgi:hypothetical protein
LANQPNQNQSNQNQVNQSIPGQGRGQRVPQRRNAIDSPSLLPMPQQSRRISFGREDLEDLFRDAPEDAGIRVRAMNLQTEEEGAVGGQIPVNLGPARQPEPPQEDLRERLNQWREERNAREPDLRNFLNGRRPEAHP